MLAKKEMSDETRNWLLKREEMAAEHLMEKAVAKYANEYAKYERKCATLAENMRNMQNNMPNKLINMQNMQQN